MEGAEGRKENWCSQHACLELNPDRKESGKGNRRCKRKGSEYRDRKRKASLGHADFCPKQRLKAGAVFIQRGV